MDRLKTLLHPLRQAVSIALLLMLLCGLVYPLLMNGLSGVLFPAQAKGSLVMVDGKAVGSRFVGQEFTQDCFLKGRPSAVHYNTYQENADGTKVYADGTPFTGLTSGSANYGPSNPQLTQRVQKDMEAFLAANEDVKPEDIPTDLMTASGSGLDPHISPESAAIQLPAISKASGLSMETLEQIVANNTPKKLLGIFGEETVNVLGVNVEIAEAMQQAA